MLKTKKRRSFFIVFLMVLMIAAVPAAVYADEENPWIAIPGQDLVADGTEETAAQPAKAPAASYPASSKPVTSDLSDTVPYLVILMLAFTAALVYRQNIIIEKRNTARDEHDAEMEEFRLKCEAARLSE